MCLVLILLLFFNLFGMPSRFVRDAFGICSRCLRDLFGMPSGFVRDECDYSIGLIIFSIKAISFSESLYMV